MRRSLASAPGDSGDLFMHDNLFITADLDQSLFLAYFAGRAKYARKEGKGALLACLFGVGLAVGTFDLASLLLDLIQALFGLVGLLLGLLQVFLGLLHRAGK
jgi:hypothetical protein